MVYYLAHQKDMGLHKNWAVGLHYYYTWQDFLFFLLDWSGLPRCCSSSFHGTESPMLFFDCSRDDFFRFIASCSYSFFNVFGIYYCYYYY